MAITTAVSAAPAWMTSLVVLDARLVEPLVQQPPVFVEVRQRYHGGVEFAGDVGRDGPDGAEVAPVRRHEDGVLEAVLVQRPAVRPDDLHQRLRRDGDGTGERHVVSGAARPDGRGGEGVAELLGDAPGEFVAVEGVHTQRQVWPVLLDGTDRDDRRPRPVLERRFDCWPYHLLETY